MLIVSSDIGKVLKNSVPRKAPGKSISSVLYIDNLNMTPKVSQVMSGNISKYQMILADLI